MCHSNQNDLLYNILKSVYAIELYSTISVFRAEFMSMDLKLLFEVISKIKKWNYQLLPALLTPNLPLNIPAKS